MYRKKWLLNFGYTQTIIDYLRDMEYIEDSGRGVSRKIIRGMIEHNGKEPDFELRGESLIVTLYA